MAETPDKALQARRDEAIKNALGSLDIKGTVKRGAEAVSGKARETWDKLKADPMFGGKPYGAQVLEMAPEVAAGVSPAGAAVDIKDMAQAIKERDIPLGTLAAAGFIPGVGDAAKAVGKKALAGVRALKPSLKDKTTSAAESALRQAEEMKTSVATAGAKKVDDLPEYDPTTRGTYDPETKKWAWKPLPPRVKAYHFGRKPPSAEWDPRGPHLGSGEGFPGGGPLGKGTYFTTVKGDAYRQYGGETPTRHEVELDTTNMVTNNVYPTPAWKRFKDVMEKNFSRPERLPDESDSAYRWRNRRELPPTSPKDLFGKVSRQRAYELLDEANVTGFYTSPTASFDEIAIFDPSVIRTRQAETFFDASSAGAKTPADAKEAKHLWQEKGTDSPYFQRWFGKSQVVDDAGKPLVMYHGTASDYEAFSDQHIGKTSDAGYFGRGFVFTDSPEIASLYASKAGGKAGSVMPTYLQLENPLVVHNDITSEPWWGEVAELAEELFAQKGYLRSVMPAAQGRIRIWRSMVENNHEAILHVGSPWRSEALREFAIRKGHDGIVVPDRPYYKGAKEVIVFDNTQIKSSVANRGTFDPKDPRITYGAAPGAFAAERMMRDGEEEGSETP